MIKSIAAIYKEFNDLYGGQWKYFCVWRNGRLQCHHIGSGKYNGLLPVTRKAGKVHDELAINDGGVKTSEVINWPDEVDYWK